MKHRFEFQDEKSSKFWEISVEGKSHTVHYGRIDTEGQVKTKTFESESKATASAEKLIKEKLKKGYLEVKTKKTISKKKAAAKKAAKKQAGNSKFSKKNIENLIKGWKKAALYNQDFPKEKDIKSFETAIGFSIPEILCKIFIAYGGLYFNDYEIDFREMEKQESAPELRDAPQWRDEFIGLNVHPIVYYLKKKTMSTLDPEVFYYEHDVYDEPELISDSLIKWINDHFNDSELDGTYDD